MIYSKGLSVPEGPVLLKDGSILVVEMGPDKGCITHITNNGRDKRIVAKTGRPNGLAVDKDGLIWCAESQKRSLLKVTLEGEVEEFLTDCNGEPFLFPNDLAFGVDGKLYMTDSGILFKDFAPGGKVRPDYKEVVIDGRVYRIDIQTKEIETIDTGLRFTNGICFSATNDLYVNETITGDILKYDWKDGSFSPRQTFGNVFDPDGEDCVKGPDGMKFGADGRLYVTVFGQQDVTVLAEDGTVAERIKTEGLFPTNLAFGLPGDNRIYVTEDEKGTLEVFDVGCDGLKLHEGKRNSERRRQSGLSQNLLL